MSKVTERSSLIQEGAELHDWILDEAWYQKNNVRRHSNDNRRRQNNIEVWAKKVRDAHTISVWLTATANLEDWPDESLQFVAWELSPLILVFDAVQGERSRRRAQEKANGSDKKAA